MKRKNRITSIFLLGKYMGVKSGHSCSPLFMLLFFSLQVIKAQDTQYSQYYANALYLNPAFTGAQENTRGIAAARYQWPGLDAAYISQSFSVDHYVKKYRSGIGLIVNSDFTTASKLRATEAGAVYAFQTHLTKRTVFRPALQVSFVNRSINFNALTFGSQYNNEGFQGGATQEQTDVKSITYADISSGGILYSDNYWAGISLHHLNTPNQSFIGSESVLPVKVTMVGGYKFSFTPEWRKKHVDPDEDKSITPTFLYKMQGKSDQLDLGLYGRYNALLAGIWYRGIPVKVFKTERMNNDALVLLLGFVHNRLSIGYSYDFTISKLTFKSGGAHELTASYTVKRKRSRQVQKKLPCPKF